MASNNEKNNREEKKSSNSNDNDDDANKKVGTRVFKKSSPNGKVRPSLSIHDISMI